MTTVIERLTLSAISAAEKADHPSQEPYIEYGDTKAVLIDGTVDMQAVTRAVLEGLAEELKHRRDGADWAAEYGESAEAAVVASNTDDLVEIIDALLQESGN